MKCLEKDRARRYETANGLAADLQRHLNNEPVAARSPSNLYRIQKMVRRNKLVFAAGAMVALALLVGMALAAWQALRASRERDAKEVALRQAVAAQKEQTRLAEQVEAEAYDSDTLLAQQAITANNFGRARELLERHRPHSKTEKDLRGWEWRYLWQQCTSDALAKVWQGTDRISDLAVSHDGKWLAVGQGSDRTAVSLLQFVGRTTTVLVTNIPPRRGTDVLLAFSPKAPLLAYCSSKYTATNVQATLHLWNIETRQSLVECPLRSFCGCLAFSPDGSALLVTVMNNHPGGSDGELLLLRIPDLTPLWTYETSITNGCPGVSIDPAFRREAVGGDRLQVIDLLTGKLRWSEADKYGDFLASAFTRDGTILLTAEGSPSRLRVWDANTGQPIAGPIPLQHGTVGTFTALPDGKSLASANADGTLQIWDVSNPTEPRALGRPLRGQFGQVSALALSADGKTLFSGSLDGSVYAWDTAPAKPDESRFLLTGIFGWGFAPNNQSILTIDPKGRVSRRDGPDFQRKTPMLEIGGDLVGFRDQAEFSSDGKFLATSRDRVVRVWDIQTGGPTPRLVTPGRLAANSFAPDSNLLIIYNDGRDSVEEWDLNAFQKLTSWPKLLPSRTEPLLLALSTGGKYLLNVSAGGDEALLRVVATGQASTWTNLGAGSVSGVSFSADGAFFAVGSERGLAQVWETTASRQRVASVGHQQHPIWAVGFSRDGSRLVTASDGSDALALWDIARGTELLRLEAGGDRFQSPRFSFDDTLLGCVNWQNDLYLWRAPSWAEIETIEKTPPDRP